MQTIQIYLAGPCKHLADGGKGWREKASTMLKQAAENVGATIRVINPVDYFSYSENKHQSDKQVKKYYLDQIKYSRLVLVNLENTTLSPGTAQELQYAVDSNVQIIGFGEKDVYPWLLVDCQAVFQSIHTAIDYIRDYYLTK